MVMYDPYTLHAQTGYTMIDITYKRYGLALAILLVAVFSVYGPILQHGFVNWADDYNFITNNALRGLDASHVLWSFSTVHLGHYQPLAWLSFNLNYTVGGMNPWVYHLTDLLLAAVNAIQLFFFIPFIIRRIIVVSPHDRTLFLLSLFTALLFILHPLRVESVAWVSARGDMICSLFYIQALFWYCRSKEHRGKFRYLAVTFLLFLLACLSRAWAMTLPLILLIFDYYPYRCIQNQTRIAAVIVFFRLIIRKAPFFIVSIAIAIVAFYARRVEMGFDQLTEHSLFHRLIQGFCGLLFYPLKTLFPYHLSPLYLLYANRPAFFYDLYPYALTAIMLSLTLFLLKNKWPGLWAAWLAYAVMISPVLGFTQSGLQLVADRYSYLATTPFYILITFVLLHLTQHRCICGPSICPFLAAGVLIMLLLIMSQQTRRLTHVWQDGQILWNYVLQRDADNYVALNLLSDFQLEHGAPPESVLPALDRALLINPRYVYGYMNRARIRTDLGDFEGALTDYNIVARLNPSTPNLFNNRGVVYYRMGQPGLGLADIDLALNMEPYSIKALLNRAMMRTKTGNYSGAIDDYSRLLHMDREMIQVYMLRGYLYQQLGRWSEAEMDYSSAIARNPTDAQLFVNRATVRQQQDRLPEAIDDCRAAIRLTPDNPLVYFNQGIALMQNHCFNEALSNFSKALELASPDWPYTVQARQAIAQCQEPQ